MTLIKVSLVHDLARVNRDYCCSDITRIFVENFGFGQWLYLNSIEPGTKDHHPQRVFQDRRTEERGDLRGGRG